MYLATMLADDAQGHILRHNLAAPDGRKALPKGRRISAADVAHLHDLGIEQVRVAVLEPGDIHEDEAARRLAVAISGPGLRATTPTASRVNLLADVHGIARIDVATLNEINLLDGLTVATVPNHTLMLPRRRIATVKIIPFAVPETVIIEAEALAASKHVVAVDPLRPHDVGVVLVGSAAAQRRIEAGVLPAIMARVSGLGSAVCATAYVENDEALVATAIQSQLDAGMECVIIAGETSIMDVDDVTPLAIRAIGGHVEQYGAPVEPGNLLLLAYIDTARGRVPLLGAPGCVRSRDVNIVDLVLPRLLTGEHLTRRDIVLLGHGGLLG